MSGDDDENLPKGVAITFYVLLALGVVGSIAWSYHQVEKEPDPNVLKFLNCIDECSRILPPDDEYCRMNCYSIIMYNDSQLGRIPEQITIEGVPHWNGQ